MLAFVSFWRMLDTCNFCGLQPVCLLLLNFRWFFLQRNNNNNNIGLRRVPYQQHSGQSRCSSSQSSTEQDRQIRQFGQHPHLLSVRHRDSRCMAWDSHRSDAGDWPAQHCCHWGHQGNRVPLPTPVHGSSTGECGLLPKYYDHRMKCRCNAAHCLVSIFPPAALC